MAYYHDLVTEKSWQELTQLKKHLDFVLIGGWAIYFYTKALKSKDIDILIDYDKLPLLNKHYTLFKNERLKKYEAVHGEVQIDIYLPFFSQLGIPGAELMAHTTQLEGFSLIDPNYLFVLKTHTLTQRGRSPKGRKDFLDLLALVLSERCDFVMVQSLLKDHNLTKAWGTFETFLRETTQVEELKLNAHALAKLKKRIPTADT